MFRYLEKTGRARFLIKNHGVEIGGQKGSKMEPFGYISKAFQYFGLIFGMKGALMVPDKCVKFGV